MKVSVVIPTFNRAELLPRALTSVFAQSWLGGNSQLEVLLIDDGSDDGTGDMIRKQFPQVNYIFQQNSGVSAARNTGIKAAGGEWIAFLDSDDEWLANKLDQQFSLLDQSGLLVCHTEEIWIRNGVRVNQMDKHQKRGGWIFEHCLPMCALSPSSCLIHSDVFREVGLFDESLPACEDYDIWLRICADYPVSYVLQACINKYGGHDDQLSRQHWGMDRFRVRALEKILATNLATPYYSAARTMLLHKLEILLNGARKRNNRELVEQCQLKIQHWQLIDGDVEHANS